MGRAQVTALPPLVFLHMLNGRRVGFEGDCFDEIQRIDEGVIVLRKQSVDVDWFSGLDLVNVEFLIVVKTLVVF